MDNSTEIISHPNGTTSVTNVLQVKDPKNQMGKEVICQVLHLGTVTMYKKTVSKGKRKWAKMSVGTTVHTHLENDEYSVEPLGLLAKEPVGEKME